MKHKDLIVIEERDLSDGEISVIGVASTLEYAEIMINRYYGIPNFTINSKRIVDESDLEYILDITVHEWETLDAYQARVILRNFRINE